VAKNVERLAFWQIDASLSCCRTQQTVNMPRASNGGGGRLSPPWRCTFLLARKNLSHRISRARTRRRALTRPINRVLRRRLGRVPRRPISRVLAPCHCSRTRGYQRRRNHQTLSTSQTLTRPDHRSRTRAYQLRQNQTYRLLQDNQMAFPIMGRDGSRVTCMV
jgi:hypothetical protein